MFSKNVKQFGIRHALMASALVALGMALVCSSWYVTVVLGAAVLVGTVGFFGGYLLMFVSDLIDDRPIDDRRWWSRFFNFLGLMAVLGTIMAIVTLGIIDLFLLWDWLLETGVGLELK